MADAADLKSAIFKMCGFDPLLRHHFPTAIDQAETRRPRNIPGAVC